LAVVGITLVGGGLVLREWVQATLTNDLRSRNERIVSFMADSLSKGRVPAELFASVNDLDGQLDQQTSADLFGRATDAEQVLSSTYFYLDGQGLSELNFKVDDQGRLVLFGRQGPPRPTAANAIEVTRDLPTQYGTLRLHAVSSIDQIDQSVSALSLGLIISLPLLIVGAGLMTWVITGRALAPVALMTSRVQELTANTLDARVPVPNTNDEIAQLGRMLNEMLDRLQKSSVTQRQFISDASHELRSPVASIRAQLETALQYPEDVDWPEVARIVLAEDDRLEHLVGNLLAMARLEEGRLGRRSEVDLDDLVMEQTRRMTAVNVDASSVSAGRVWGNPDELTSVIRNLLDNAARYAESVIKVGVREDGPWVTLTVADDGPGVPEGERLQVFERFARLQEGRERDKGGTGLGLSLTKRIVESHGGTIRVESSESGGALFVVLLPATAAAGWSDQ
jgi:signal transduction histidine kinase